jgi:hypothetical protein
MNNVLNIRKILGKIYYLIVIPFRDYSITYVWLFVSLVAKFISKRVKISPIILNKNMKKIYFIVPNEKNYLIYKSPPSRDPDDLGKLFLEETTEASVEIMSSDEIFSLRNDGETVIATWVAGTHVGLSWYLYYLKVLILSFKLRRKNIPVIVFLCDTYYADAATIAVTLTSLTGGVSIFLQNSRREISNFGYSSFVWPAFWVPIVSRILNAPNSEIPWKDRKNVCMLASGLSATARRIDLMNQLGIYMRRNNYDLLLSNGNFEIQDYIDLLGTVKFYASTNFVQEVFHIGSKRYRKKMSNTTTTGRTWNAFAAGMVLISNETDNLKELGFIPSVHYLDLMKIVGDQTFRLPEDDELSTIARNGRDHYINLMKRGFDYANINW